MVHFSFLNNDVNLVKSQVKDAFEDCFKYTNEVYVHIVSNMTFPTNELGSIKHIFFIDVPYRQGNYYRNSDKVYLNSLAIAVREFIEPDAIDADNEHIYTNKGCWNINEQMESDRNALRDYVYSHMPDVTHFDIAMFYHILAPNCKKHITADKLSVNSSCDLWKTIDYAINITKSNIGKRTDCIVCGNYGQDESVWAEFVQEFVDLVNIHTQPGNLTKKKMDLITSAKLSNSLQKLYDSAGNKLTIIKGKAGTGKSMALLKVMFNQVHKEENVHGHNCRLLTYNNLLVADLKQSLKKLGDFTPTKASISTIHKFIYSIYKDSPVCLLHMDNNEIDKLFSTCMYRIVKVNKYLEELYADREFQDFRNLRSDVQKMRCTSDELPEVKMYCRYLSNIENPNLSKLDTYTEQYVKEKRKKLLDNYFQKQFIAGYNVIVQELYFIFHNFEEYEEKYGLRESYTRSELRNSAEFKEKYESLFNDFLRFSRQKMISENYSSEAAVRDFGKRINKLESALLAEITSRDYDEKITEFKATLKKISRKVNWSHLLLIDEAQDCTIYEKALLYELFGSDNIVLASGGNDQLIRSAKENHWDILFGKKLDCNTVQLRATSYRQKGNIVKFLNAFSEKFKLGTKLEVSEELADAGRVIIDCRNTSTNAIPFDKVDSMYQVGKKYGCSNFENILFMLPQHGYVDRTYSENPDVFIDQYDTVNFLSSLKSRKLTIEFPEYLNVMNGTANDKREFINNVGQDNSRCILYNSCRGLEAWNIYCVDFDKFYEEMLESKDAEEYAETVGGGIFAEGHGAYQEKFASIWCYMALTRGMDTIYIRLADTNSDFSSKILDIAESIPEIEVLRGKIHTDGLVKSEAKQGLTSFKHLANRTR